MTTFDDRERAFENLFAHDDEMRFRVQARRNRAVAAWAAARMGSEGAVAAAYQDEIVNAGVGGLDDAALAQRVAADLAKGGHTVPVAEVRAEMDRQAAIALQHERAS